MPLITSKSTVREELLPVDTAHSAEPKMASPLSITTTLAIEKVVDEIIEQSKITKEDKKRS